MKSIRLISIVLLVVVSLNALVAGCLFMADPSGHKLGTSVAILHYTTFNDFFLPGLVLFAVNGLFGLITAVAVIRRWAYYPVRLGFQGLLLTGWIVIQVLMLRQFNVLHGILGAVGVFLIWAAVKLLKQPAT